MKKAETLRPLIIGSMRRSGGTLLANLFDGHTACHVFPFEHWHTETKATHNGRVMFLFPLLSAEVKFQVCGMGSAPESKVDGFYGTGTWHRIRPAVLTLASKSPTPARFFDAFSRFCFKELAAEKPRRWIVNHCANVSLLGVRRVRRIFGSNAEIVVSIRDPRATFASMKRGRSSTGRGTFSEEELRRFCANWRMVYHLYRSREVHGVKFEELLESPESAMRNLIGALGLPFEKVLLRPTAGGKLVSHNSSFLTRGEGDGEILKQPLTHWRQCLAPEDAATIEGFLEPEMKQAGYH